MNILGLNFTTKQAFDYIKQHWKPGKRELTYISIYVIILIIGTAVNSTTIYLANAEPIVNTNGETLPPPIDYDLMAARDFGITILDFFAFGLLTLFYFKASDKKASNALKWGVAYAVPIVLVGLASNIQYWSTLPKDYITATYNPTLGIIADILYMPASFLLALLIAGGLYLFFVYRPNLTLTIIGYVAMVVLLFCFGVALRGTYALTSPYTYEIFFSFTGLSLMGIWFAIKNQVAFKPFPQAFLFGGTIFCISILSWISDIPLGDYSYEFVSILSYIIFGFILYFLLNMNLGQTQMGAVQDLPPPPPPPPPT
ncbi:MAG: hypothetical protein NWE93_14420 [Candidatus Bathyarchaeota archaeon]|nr:hypothetical protein [Candidatus Bathyarchaeota archaeon]